jgi:hypothetical protein
MNGFDIICIKAFQHLSNNLLLPRTLIVWENDYRRLMAKSSPSSLYLNNLRRREIGKERKEK